MPAIFTKPTAITIPFCNSGNKIAPPNTSSTVASQELGFPVIQSTPLGSGGLPVDRTQTNGVINEYSQFSLWNSVGGQWTFDPIVAAAGGYNAGAILWCASNSSYQLSLVDNNTADFVTTPAYINDGINWNQITSTNEGLFNSYKDITTDGYIVQKTDGFTLLVMDASNYTINFNLQTIQFPIGWSCCLTSTPGDYNNVTFTDSSGNIKTFTFGVTPNKYMFITVGNWGGGAVWYIDSQKQSDYNLSAGYTQSNFDNVVSVTSGTVALNYGYKLLSFSGGGTLAFPLPNPTFPKGWSCAVYSGSSMTLSFTDAGSVTNTYTFPQSTPFTPYRIYTDGINWFINDQIQANYLPPASLYTNYTPSASATYTISAINHNTVINFTNTATVVTFPTSGIFLGFQCGIRYTGSLSGNIQIKYGTNVYYIGDFSATMPSEITTNYRVHNLNLAADGSLYINGILALSSGTPSAQFCSPVSTDMLMVNTVNGFPTPGLLCSTQPINPGGFASGAFSNTNNILPTLKTFVGSFSAAPTAGVLTVTYPLSIPALGIVNLWLNSGYGTGGGGSNTAGCPLLIVTGSVTLTSFQVRTAPTNTTLLQGQYTLQYV
jgi:hypothetical protein